MILQCCTLAVLYPTSSTVLRNEVLKRVILQARLHTPSREGGVRPGTRRKPPRSHALLTRTATGDTVAH